MVCFTVINVLKYAERKYAGKSGWLQILTYFSPMSHFYTPWKCQKTVFRGYRNVTLEQNGLTSEKYTVPLKEWMAGSLL